MMEPVELPPARPSCRRRRSREQAWAITGTDSHPGRNVIFSLRMEPDVLEAHVEHSLKNTPGGTGARRYQTQIWTRRRSSSSRSGPCPVCAPAIELLEAEGIPAGLIRPISLVPFPNAAFDEIGKKTRIVISTELSMGQMLPDVRAAVRDRWPVGLIHRTGGIVPSSLEIVARAKKLLEEVQ
jgi:2-oxoglutarate ferredoxin oxidoreductase subunit alpha